MANYNSGFTSPYSTATLGDLQTEMLSRLGFGTAQAGSVTSLLTSFLKEAQTLLYLRYPMFKTKRFFTWAFVPGVRFYELTSNTNTDITQKMDASSIDWVGISEGDNIWRPLICGIDPTLYVGNTQSIPEFYEIRDSIEVWPIPSSAAWSLRVKGEFGLAPFAVSTDVTTIDPTAIFLQALSRAQAYYGKGEAKITATDLQIYIGDMIARSHMTRRYIPGTESPRNAVRPVMV